MVDEQGNNFLSKLFPDLHKSKEVNAAVINSLRNKNSDISPDSLLKGEKIDAYLSRLENLFLDSDEKVRKRNINLVIRPILDEVIISEKKFPETYFELQREIAARAGHGEIDITDRMREQAIQVVQEDQKASLMRWVDYLSSDDAPYPAWFKYYVLRSVIKLEPFDKATGQINKRSKSSTKIFPEINNEALTQVFESLTSNEPMSEGALKTLVENGKFSNLYAFAIQKQISEMERAKEDRDSIKGEWVKYLQNSDPQPLVDSLQGKGTGWCTSGLETARAQLNTGDFYVFYSYDDDQKPTIPRIAIRMGQGQVAEVRGVQPGQELESELVETARDKFSELPGGKKYEKKVSDMKKLTEIADKTDKGIDLTIEEINFLYQKDGTIEGFGWYQDPRIKKIINQRIQNLGIATNFGDDIYFSIEILEVKTKAGTELTDEERSLQEKLLNEKKLSTIKQKIKNKDELDDYELKFLYSDPDTLKLLSHFHGGDLFRLILERSDDNQFPPFSGEFGYYLEKIKIKFNNNQPFSKEELKHLYAASFKTNDQDFFDDMWGEDYEKFSNYKEFITRVMSTRDRMKDLAEIYDISPSQVADHEADLTDETVVFDGNLKLKGFMEYVPKNLRVIYGDFDISESHIEEMSSLIEIKGSLILAKEKRSYWGRFVDKRSNGYLTSLGNLEVVEGNLDASDSSIEDLGKLKVVGGWLDLRRTKIKPNQAKDLKVESGISY